MMMIYIFYILYLGGHKVLIFNGCMSRTITIWGLTITIWGLTITIWGLTITIWGLTITLV
jgi:hypothetical protein